MYHFILYIHSPRTYALAVGFPVCFISAIFTAVINADATDVSLTVSPLFCTFYVSYPTIIDAFCTFFPKAAEKVQDLLTKYSNEPVIIDTIPAETPYVSFKQLWISLRKQHTSPWPW